MWTRSIALLFLAFATVRAAPAPVVVHEWGTFTSLQAEDGRTVGGINVEDEPLPKFVHELGQMLLIRAGNAAPVFYQGAPAAHPDVTMRLETPVIYFHLPPGSPSVTADVSVRFSGGWLTQFYPAAAADTRGPGADVPYERRPIEAGTIGTLRWSRLRIGPPAAGPETADHVWVAPRKVDAADVTTPAGESERFLFYRGVGHVDSPIQVMRDPDNQLLVRDLDGAGNVQGPLWLVDIRQDGACAFRRISSMPATPPASPVGSGAFDAADYSKANVTLLRGQMHEAIVQAGLLPDEADALLNTWELSYFKSAGQRLFFLVPRGWTDRVLPLEISIPADVTRVMVGRVELIGPRERKLLADIAQGPTSDARWGNALVASAKGQSTTVTPPADYQAYRALGRLRDAILLDAVQHNPADALRQFVKNYGLHPVAVDRGRVRPSN